MLAVTPLDPPFAAAVAGLGNEYMIDVSNVGLDGRALPRDDFRRVSAIANRLWHVDSSYKDYPATWSLLSARSVPAAGGDTEFADCAAAYEALDDAMKARIAPLEGVHSIATGRAALGFTDFTPEERAALPPKRHPLVRTLADGRRDAAALRPRPSLARWRPRDVG